MANDYFRFKQFTVYQDRSAMKVTTDGCLFGAWCARELTCLSVPSRPDSAVRALDIGTGTGLLSLMVAQEHALRIHAVEIDPGAAAQAAQNVASSPFLRQISVMETDVLHLQDHGYEVIFSNPPFYENELKSGKSARDTAHHSQQLTWAELFAAINRLLDSQGVFFLLLPYKREGELNTYLQREGFFINKLVRVKQSTRHAPFRLMVRGSRTASLPEEEELTIKGADQQYTPEFTALLKDYYLHL